MNITEAQAWHRVLDYLVGNKRKGDRRTDAEWHAVAGEEQRDRKSVV